MTIRPTLSIFTGENNKTKWDIPYTSLNLTQELNIGSNLKFNFNWLEWSNYCKAFGDFDGVAVLTTSKVKVQVNKGENVYFVGYISRIGFAGTDSGDYTLSCEALDFMSILSTRLSSTVFTQVNADQIAWSLIEETQNEVYGDLGIIRGVIEQAKKRDRTLDYDNIKDVIVGMSRNKLSDGFDWEINTQGIFNLKAKIGEEKPDIIFSGSNSKNIQVALPMIGKLANVVTARGATSNSEESPPEITIQDLVEAEKWGRHEIIVKPNGVSEIDTLTEKAQAELDVKSNPRNALSISLQHLDQEQQYGGLPLTWYNLGDTVRAYYPELKIDGMYEVRKRTMNTTANLDTITVNLANDTPADQYFKDQLELARIARYQQKANYR